MALLSVVIPVGRGDSPATTLATLERQTFRDFTVIVSPDQKGNANWARNRGFEQVLTPLVLFSDADIQWLPRGIEAMVEKLQSAPKASYSYGAFQVGGQWRPTWEFCPLALQRANYISTMSVIRTEHFPGFDESLERLQDWDLWLTLLAQRRVGVFCGERIFRTERRNGITYGGRVTYAEAERVIKLKHRLQ